MHTTFRGVSFRMARKPGIVEASDLIVNCIKMKDRLEETIRELEKDDRFPELIRKRQEATKKHSERFRGTKTRGLKMTDRL
jgi:hypothetical protein